MSVIIVRLLHCRPIHRSYPNTFHHLFFSSTVPDSSDHHRQTEQESELRQTPTPPISYFNDIKANLLREPSPQNRPPRPQPFSNHTPPQTPTSPVRLNSYDDIRRNLTEYRRSDQSVSLQELYRRNQNSNSANTVQTPSIGLLSEKIRQMRSVGPNQSFFSPKSVDPSILARSNDNTSGTTDPNSQLDSDSFPSKKKGTKYDDTLTDASDRSALIRPYEKPELGKKLQMLRPNKTKGDWFTIHELNERLAKLREYEEEERPKQSIFKQLRQSIVNLKDGDTDKRVQAINVLKNLGETPSFMLEPPKEHLAEQYFHPDCMSSAEKLKLELKKVRDEFKMSECDCGSARVQVAQLTTKIKHLSSVLAKKDKHSRKGLMEMVQRRKKLLKYLRRTDWDSYTLLLSKLGLRDNPDTKIKA